MTSGEYAGGDDEEARLRALSRYEIIGTAPEKSFDRITSMAARIFGVPIALSHSSTASASG